MCFIHSNPSITESESLEYFPYQAYLYPLKSNHICSELLFYNLLSHCLQNQCLLDGCTASEKQD